MPKNKNYGGTGRNNGLYGPSRNAGAQQPPMPMMPPMPMHGGHNAPNMPNAPITHHGAPYYIHPPTHPVQLGPIHIPIVLHPSAFGGAPVEENEDDGFDDMF